MVFSSGVLVVALCILFAIWMAALTVAVLRMIRHYNKLVAVGGKAELKSTLDALIGGGEYLKSRASNHDLTLRDLQSKAQFYFQKIGIVRFNPFSDTGGSQSFTMALLDGKDNGIVMTSLYARTGNRWYVKRVREGKGYELELSKEEQSAIKKAIQTDQVERDQE